MIDETDCVGASAVTGEEAGKSVESRPLWHGSLLAPKGS